MISSLKAGIVIKSVRSSYTIANVELSVDDPAVDVSFPDIMTGARVS